MKDKVDWPDIELLSLKCAELRDCVALVKSGTLTKEESLTRTALRLSIFRQQMKEKIEKAIETRNVNKLL